MPRLGFVGNNEHFSPRQAELFGDFPCWWQGRVVGVVFAGGIKRALCCRGRLVGVGERGDATHPVEEEEWFHASRCGYAVGS